VSTNFFLKKLPQNCGRKNCGNKLKREMTGTKNGAEYQPVIFLPISRLPVIYSQPLP
jgi:hypothetical protein